MVKVDKAVWSDKEAVGGAALFWDVAVRSVGGEVAVQNVDAADIAPVAEAVDEPADSDRRRRPKRVRPACRTSRNATGALGAEKFVATHRLHRVARHLQTYRTVKLVFWERHLRKY